MCKRVPKEFTFKSQQYVVYYCYSGYKRPESTPQMWVIMKTKSQRVGEEKGNSFVFHPHQPPSENRKLENTYKLTLLNTVLWNVFTIQLYCSICLFASRGAHLVDKCTRRSWPRRTRRREMAEGKKPKGPREHARGAALSKKQISYLYFEPINSSR